MNYRNLFLFVVFLPTTLFAKDKTYSLSFFAGGYAQSGYYLPVDNWHFDEQVKLKSDFLSSIDFEAFTNKHVGFHAAVVVYPAATYERLGIYHFGPLFLREDMSFTIFEAGPSFNVPLSTDVSFYLHVSPGFVIDGGDSDLPPYWWHKNFVHANLFTVSTTIGLKLALTEQLGLSLQGSYRYIDQWNAKTIYDMRLGVSYRF